MEDSGKHPANDKKNKFKTSMLVPKKENKRWILIITISSFFLSAMLSLISSNIMNNVIVASIVVLLIITVNILFDIIGTAVTAADEAPFHAMASRKVYGAKQAIRLIRNADRVSNFCNDVVGDICGVISGSAGTFILISIVRTGADNETTLAGLVFNGIIAALTVGGKALGKSIAIGNSNYIIYKVGVLIKFFTKKRLSTKKKSMKARW